MNSEEGEDEKGDSVFKSKHYFDLGAAVQDLKTEFQFGGVADKATSTAKLFGKSVFNLGLLAGKVTVEAAKNLPQIAAKIAEEQLRGNKNMSNEQRSKLEDIIERGKK